MERDGLEGRDLDRGARRRFAGRSGALFLVVVGVVTVTDTLLRGAGDLKHLNRPAAIIAGLATTVVGIVVFALPWERWPRRAPMVLPFVIVALVVPLDRLVRFSTDPAVNASCSMLAFTLLAWIGLTQERWTAAWFAPFLAGSLAVTAMTLPGSTMAATVPLAIVPVAALLAEISSLIVNRLDESMEAQAAHSQALALVAAPFPVEGDREELEVAIVERAQAVFEVDDVVLLADGPDGRAPRAGKGLSSRERALVAESLGAGTLVVDDDVVVVPLTGSAASVGALVLRRPGPVFGPLTLNLAAVFGQQAGSALVGQLLIDSLLSDARRDPLTGVGNRRAALDLLDGLGPGESVALVDVDGFKAVNDSGGHAEGDALLCRLAEGLVALTGDATRVTRLGGDEFLVVLATQATGEEPGDPRPGSRPGWGPGARTRRPPCRWASPTTSRAPRPGTCSSGPTWRSTGRRRRAATG